MKWKATAAIKNVKKFPWGDALLIALALGLGGIGSSKSLSSAVRRTMKPEGRTITAEEFNVRRFHTTLYRLKRSGLVEYQKGKIWHILNKGIKRVTFLERRSSYGLWQKLKKRRDAIIVFDVPEQERKKRDLLRIELIALGFTQIQKSVWRGFGPLPEAFIAFMRDINILSYVHIFSVEKAGTLV